jgi:uncharacterized protein YndB with AHSA1/START domain
MRRLWQQAEHGDAGGFECGLVELVSNEPIVFHWGFVGPDRADGPTYDSLLTITLRDALDGATTLTFVHEQLEALDAAMPQVAENLAAGWQVALDKLSATLQPVG